VADQLPPAVRAEQTEFNTCDCCHRVYWKGSHWKRMVGVLARAADVNSEPSA
jgi:uncharacterized protein with PIN domain